MDKVNVYNIIIAGIGGQGIISVTDIISQCAMNCGFEVRCFGDYGMARRGGAVNAHIRIGLNGKIYIPIVTEGSGDLLIGTELIETVRNSYLLKKNGMIVTNSQIIHPTSGIKRDKALNSTRLFEFLKGNIENCLTLDGAELTKQTGYMSLNMIMLGAGCATSGFPLSTGKIKEDIKTIYHPHEDKNIKAFEMGYNKIKYDIARNLENRDDKAY